MILNQPVFQLTSWVSQDHIVVLKKLIIEAKIEEKKELTISICSHGGMINSALDIIQIIEELQKKNVKVTTYGIDIIGSAALDIFICGDKKIIEAGTKIKPHLPEKWEKIEIQLGLSTATETLNELTKKNKDILIGRERWIDFFSEKTGITKEQFLEIENKTLTAQEFYELGLCDGVI